MDILSQSSIVSSTPTFVDIPSSYGYDSFFGSSTTSSNTPAFTGSDDYPVFPNGVYISKFYIVSSQDSGLTDLDIDLYNECYLPANPLSHHSQQKRDVTTSSITPRPTYLIDEAPCKRAAAIDANCYFENTNGTFSGLQPYSDHFDAQQQCYCLTYPYFDSTLGCMQCFKDHGGIEGMHILYIIFVNHTHPPWNF